MNHKFKTNRWNLLAISTCIPQKHTRDYIQKQTQQSASDPHWLPVFPALCPTRKKLKRLPHAFSLIQLLCKPSLSSFTAFRIYIPVKYVRMSWDYYCSVAFYLNCTTLFFLLQHTKMRKNCQWGNDVSVKYSTESWIFEKKN